MTNPNILWRESFGYGSLTWSQTYLKITRATNNPYGDIAVGDPGTLSQWGRGSGSDQGFAMIGGYAALRASQLGFSGAIDTNAVSNNKVGITFAYNQASHIGGSILCEFWDDDGLGDGSFSKALLHLSIETLADGRIAAICGASTIVGISTFVMPVGLNGQTGNFTHIEVTQPKIHATNGSVQVYADSALVLNITGAATRNALLGSGKIGYVQANSTNSSGSARISTDLVIHDCANAGVIGDKRVTYRRAAVAGTYTSGTPAGSGSPATRLAAVSEQAADGDVSYVLLDNTALPKKVSFTTEAMPANTLTIDEVTEHIIYRKTDASANTGRQGMKSGATEVNNGTDQPTPSGYATFTQTRATPGHQVDPNTSSAWTVPNCDAVEIIYDRTA